MCPVQIPICDSIHSLLHTLCFIQRHPGPKWQRWAATVVCWHLEKIQRRLNNGCMPFICRKSHPFSVFSGSLSRQFLKGNAKLEA